MKMKQWLLLVTLLTMTVTSAVGCSKSQAKEEATTVPPAPAQEDTTPIKIQYWHSHDEDQTAGLDYMIKEFNKKYPYITVEPVFQGDYDELQQKLMAAVAAKQVPAVTNVEVAKVPNFSESGMLADLSPYIARDKMDTADFSTGMLKAYNYQDKQYGLPLIVSTSVFVYNKTMFDKEGVTPPQSWDEIEAFAQKLTKKEGNKTTRFAFSVPGWSSWYYDPWIMNGGGSVLTQDNLSAIDQPDSMKFMNKFKEWKDKGYMHIGYGKGASDTMRQMFFDGKIGMVEHTSALIKWYMEKAKFEVGVSFLPGDKKRISQIGGAGIAVMDMASEKEKEAAWKFVQFMTAPENNIKWAEFTGYLPTRKSAIESEEGKQYFSKYPQYKAVFDNFDNVMPRDQHPAYDEVSEFYVQALGKVVLENADVEASFKEAAKQMNDVLAEYATK